MSFRCKRVAVIGAGISGIVAAAHLKNEGIEVTVFERSSAAGGIWLYDERKPLEPPYPRMKHSRADSVHVSEEMGDIERVLHAPPGPCYVGLKNNVSTRFNLLETTLNPFPPGTEDYVTHRVLCDYIQATATVTGVHKMTQYDTDVRNVTKSGRSWTVEMATLQTDANGRLKRIVFSRDFDAVVVASGHYHSPRVPDTPGLADWKREFPARVQHSKRYRRPENGQDKNYLLVGGSVSATDIARELSPYANKIVQSQRKGQFDLPSSMLPENAHRVDEIVCRNLRTACSAR